MPREGRRKKRWREKEKQGASEEVEEEEGKKMTGGRRKTNDDTKRREGANQKIKLSLSYPPKNKKQHSAGLYSFHRKVTFLLVYKHVDSMSDHIILWSSVQKRRIRGWAVAWVLAG